MRHQCYRCVVLKWSNRYTLRLHVLQKEFCSKGQAIEETTGFWRGWWPFSAGGSTSAKKYAPYAVSRRGGGHNTSFPSAGCPIGCFTVNAHAAMRWNYLLSKLFNHQMMVALEPVRKNGAWTVSSCLLTKLSRNWYEVFLKPNVASFEWWCQPAMSSGNLAHAVVIKRTNCFQRSSTIDVFTENDYTYEEMKMTNEIRKSWKMIAFRKQRADSSLVGSLRESVETEVALTKWKLLLLLPSQVQSPEDDVVKSTSRYAVIHMWVVSDNLLKKELELGQSRRNPSWTWTRTTTAELKFELKWGAKTEISNSKSLISP